VISPLRPCANIMYLKFFKCTKYKNCITAYFCVSYDSQDTEIISVYSISRFVIIARWKVFTVRYGLTLYTNLYTLLILSLIKKPFHGSNGLSPTTEQGEIGSIRRNSYCVMRWTKYSTVIGFCFSTSDLTCVSTIPHTL